MNLVNNHNCICQQGLVGLVTTALPGQGKHVTSLVQSQAPLQTAAHSILAMQQQLQGRVATCRLVDHSEQTAVVFGGITIGWQCDQSGTHCSALHVRSIVEHKGLLHGIWHHIG